MEWIAKLLLGAAALVSLWFVIRGMIDMQRVNAADSDVVEATGVVRQVHPRGRFDQQGVVTLNVDDQVVHVDCVLPAPWFSFRRWQVTDLIPVLWRRGDARATAVATIRDGQRMFIIGVAALAAVAVLFVLLF